MGNALEPCAELDSNAGTPWTLVSTSRILPIIFCRFHVRGLTPPITCRLLYVS